jgi:hypothetical protein
MNRNIVLVIAKAAFGASLALGFLVAAPHGIEVSDDNADGHIDEDESGWDCATMGKRGLRPRCDVLPQGWRVVGHLALVR